MVRLDPEAVTDPPANWTVIETEVDFLHSALDEGCKLIRGEYLCRWAQDLYDARGVEYQVIASPTRKLRQVCPSLTVEQARELLQRMQMGDSFTDTLQLCDIARDLWDDLWWCQAPSLHHAASWLQWWLRSSPTHAEKVLLLELAKEYQQASSGRWSEVYRIQSRDDAEHYLECWLGLNDSSADWPDFPQVFEPAAKAHLITLFQKHVVKDPAAVRALFEKPSVSDKVLPLAADVLATYYQQHPEELSSAFLKRFDRYLLPATSSQIRQLLPLEPPKPPPHDHEQLVAWFLNDYLPYRQWPRHDRTIVTERGRQFAEVFLPLYADAISGSHARQSLSWMKAKSLKDPAHATLLVVLDGLSYPDMQQCWYDLQAFDIQGRLSLMNVGVAFAPLPSITRCAKPALLAGVTPRLADQASPLGAVYSKDADLLQAASSVTHGELLIWRVAEPDKSYHEYSDKATALTMAHSALKGIISRLMNIVTTMPPTVNLQIVVTTDHGRLLAESFRSVDLPEGMTSHQRAALGATNRTFPSAGFIIENDVAYLDAHRFELTQDAAIVLSDASFKKQDGRTGTDAFPHGGVYPEEVLIPWWVIGRDVKLLTPVIELSGKGVGTRIGNLVLSIQNPSPVPLDVQALTISWHPSPFELNFVVEPQSKRQVEIQVPWPTKKQLAGGSAHVLYSYREAKVAEVAASLHLSSEEMYEQDNPLEDLL